MKNLQKVSLSDLSDIKVEYYIGVSDVLDYKEVLVIKYSGTYGLGSAGNADATYMSAMGKAAIEAWEPNAVIFDLQELDYEWGDRLEYVFGIGVDKYADEPFPVAVIVGLGCEEAVRTLLLGVNSKEPVSSTGWVFKDFKKAWTFINEELKKYV